MLSNFKIVLVETSHPGNIGGVARAMKNMAISDLCLVSPKIFPSADATARAAGSDDILSSAVVYDSLQEAVADCQVVLGASARDRTISWPSVTARECAEKFVDTTETSVKEKIAIVYVVPASKYLILKKKEGRVFQLHKDMLEHKPGDYLDYLLQGPSL